MENEHEKFGHNIGMLVNENTDMQQFETIVEQLLPVKTKEVLGENARDKVLKAMFAPMAEGSTFDEEGLRAPWLPFSEDDKGSILQNESEFQVVFDTLKEW